MELACQEQFLGEAQRRAIAQAAVAALQARTPPSTPQASPRSSGGPHLPALVLGITPFSGLGIGSRTVSRGFVDI